MSAANFATARSAATSAVTHGTRAGALALTAVAFAACLAFLGLVPAATAQPDPPTFTAQHLFIGDPLFGLDTPAGTLFGKLPDEKTAMASTTKIWTLDLTAHALAEGKVHLDDKVEINLYEAGYDPLANSLMKDVMGTPLEAGEIVKLRDLIRGMIYHSGNDAAYAVGRHVATAYFGAFGAYASFASMMSAHAAALGQSNTHLQNPAGFDNVSHYTTARELAEEFQHGLDDPYFAEVVGFEGTYNATTQGPNGPKLYSFEWGRQDWYSGWEGEKGGSSPACSAATSGCGVMAATRIGRRVVLGEMQAKTGEEPAMFDYGFATIFHPDARGESSPGGTVDRQAVDCFGSYAVSAVLPPSGPVKLALWRPNVDASTIAKLHEALLPGSGNPARGHGDVAVTHLPSGDIVLATRKGSNVELSRWTINRGGGLTLLASGIKAGAATTMGIQSVYGDTFLTAMTEPDGDMVVKSWRLQGTGIVNLDTYTDELTTTYTEVVVAGPLQTDALNGHRAVTAAVGYVGSLMVHAVWGVDEATGAISLLSAVTDLGGRNSHLSISPVDVNPAFDGELPPAYYATAHRDFFGGLTVRFHRIASNGTPVPAGKGQADIDVADVRVAPLGTGGLMSAILEPQGKVRLVAWDAHRNVDDTITARSVAEESAPGASSLDLCRTPSTHAEGDYVTSTRDLDGQLRLRAYRSGDRPY